MLRCWTAAPQVPKQLSFDSVPSGGDDASRVAYAWHAPKLRRASGRLAHQFRTGNECRCELAARNAIDIPAQTRSLAARRKPCTREWTYEPASLSLMYEGALSVQPFVNFNPQHRTRAPRDDTQRFTSSSFEGGHRGSSCSNCRQQDFWPGDPMSCAHIGSMTSCLGARRGT